MVCTFQLANVQIIGDQDDDDDEDYAGDEN